jgi:hypothetical protein
MKLIKLSEQTADCRQCRHYFFRNGERFPHGCLALEYIGRQPASEIVLNAAERPCTLFAPSVRSEQ